jgi:hypothetical protein
LTKGKRRTELSIPLREPFKKTSTGIFDNLRPKPHPIREFLGATGEITDAPQVIPENPPETALATPVAAPAEATRVTPVETPVTALVEATFQTPVVVPVAPTLLPEEATPVASVGAPIRSFDEFKARWKPVLRKGQLKICEVLFEKSHALGQDHCYTSYPQLSALSGLQERQCYNLLGQLEALGFIHRERVTKGSNKLNAGSKIILYLSPKN